MCFCGFAVAIVDAQALLVVVVVATFMSLCESPLTKHNDVSCDS